MGQMKQIDLGGMVMSSKLTAGYARLDVTPPLGTPIGGYFKARYNKGVLDPIYVRAAAFGEGEKGNTCDMFFKK